MAGFTRPWFAYANTYIIPDPGGAISDRDFQKAIQKADQMGAIMVGTSVYLADVRDFAYRGKGGARRGFAFHTEVERNNCLAALNGAPAPRIAKEKVEILINNGRASLFGAK
jgi:hypothetical protein